MVLYAIMNAIAGVVLFGSGYFVGYRRREPPEPFFDTRKCICTHASVHHQPGKRGFKSCTVVLKQTDRYGDRYPCACKQYVPNPEESLI